MALLSRSFPVEVSRKMPALAPKRSLIAEIKTKSRTAAGGRRSYLSG